VALEMIKTVLERGGESIQHSAFSDQPPLPEASP
jgi:hypothetical protein